MTSAMSSIPSAMRPTVALVLNADETATAAGDRRRRIERSTTHDSAKPPESRHAPCLELHLDVALRERARERGMSGLHDSLPPCLARVGSYWHNGSSP